MPTTVCFRDQIFTMNSTYKYAINKNIHLNEGKSVQFDIVVISAHLRYESKHTFTINVSKLNMKKRLTCREGTISPIDIVTSSFSGMKERNMASK